MNSIRVKHKTGASRIAIVLIFSNTITHTHSAEYLKTNQVRSIGIFLTM